MRSEHDTIAACSTPVANAPVAMIRLSGPAVREIASDRLAIDPFARGCRDTALTLGDRSLAVTAITYATPSSYTGDDVLEILLPGNPTLIARVLDSFEGVRPADPGEFSARAYLSGRLTLEQAEGVAQAITAESDAELAAARDLLTGARGQTYRAWTDRLAHLLALTEAGIDFTDQEDVVAITPDELARGLAELAAELAAALCSAGGSEAPSARPSVALVGPPSAGKSTLFNALLGRDRALTDRAPGTTRDVLREPLDLSGVAAHAGVVDLLDLPGLDPPRPELVGPGVRPAGDTAAQAQAAAREALRAADLRLYCDPTGRFADRFPPPTLRVRTKADRPSELAGESITVCALDGSGVAPLKRAVADHAVTTAPGLPPRHTAAFARAIEAVDLARGQAGPDELAARAMRDALDALASLTGEVTPDDVIGRVFAAFCVGK
ncbi:MAG: GTPase [Planctomycetota bacterium]